MIIESADLMKFRSQSRIYQIYRSVELFTPHFKYIRPDMFSASTKRDKDYDAEVFWIAVHGLFWFGTFWQAWFELSTVKLYREWPGGERKLPLVSKRFELPKITLKQMSDENPWESDFRSSKPEDRVSGGSRQLYGLRELLITSQVL